MSNYTIVTNYLAKDSLISGNPAKLIKGADLTTEFTAVQAALNSKVDGVVQFFPDGSATQPSVGFTNNAGTGMFNAAGAIGLATSNINRLSISAAGLVAVSAPTSGQALTVTGAANSFALVGVASPTSGQSFGLLSQGGTTAADFSAKFLNQAGSASYLAIAGDGSIQVGAPTGGNKGLGTINATGLFVNNAAVSTTTSVGANPSVSVGLSAVNGSALTFMRSDGAPALSQAIAPTWTGAHIFAGSGDPITLSTNHAAGNGIAFTDTNGSPQSFRVGLGIGTGGTDFVVFDATHSVNRLVISAAGGATLTAGVSAQGLTVNANTNAYGIVINQQASAGTSFGLLVQAGTSASDFALKVNNAATSVNYLNIDGAGSMTVGSPTGGAQGLGTINAAGLFVNGKNVVQTGTFTGTLGGGTATTPTATFNYTIVNNAVAYVDCQAGLTATSTSTANPTITGMPAALTPARGQNVAMPSIMDNTTNQAGGIGISGTTLTIFKAAASAFTASGSKGLGLAPSGFSYSLV